MTSARATTTTTPAVPQLRRHPGPFHLGRRIRLALLTLHVLSAVGWFGVAATVAFFGYAAAASDDGALRDALHLAMRSAIPLSMPAGLLTAATGVVLSLGTRWGLTRYWWILIKEAITIVVIVTDPLVLLPAIRRSLDDGNPFEPFGPMTAHVVMLAVATILSTVKPFGRRRASS